MQTQFEPKEEELEEEVVVKGKLESYAVVMVVCGCCGKYARYTKASKWEAMRTLRNLGWKMAIAGWAALCAACAEKKL